MAAHRKCATFMYGAIGFPPESPLCKFYTIWYFHYCTKIIVTNSVLITNSECNKYYQITFSPQTTTRNWKKLHRMFHSLNGWFFVKQLYFVQKHIMRTDFHIVLRKTRRAANKIIDNAPVIISILILDFLTLHCDLSEAVCTRVTDGSHWIMGLME